MNDGSQHPAILASDAAREATVDRLRRGSSGGGPGRTVYVRNQRERPNRWSKLLGEGDPDA